MGIPWCVVANVLICNIVVNEFELQLCFYVHLRTNTSGKSINPLMLYTQLCLYEQRWTGIYKNISLILFSKGAHSWLLIWEIDGETYSQRGDFFLSHIFFQEPGGANACTRLLSVSSETSETPLMSCLSLARLPILLTLYKSDCMVLISHALLPVTHMLDRPAPTHCHAPVYKSQRDSLSKHTGSRGTNRKSMSYVI